ncbi:hypothetical protein BFL35_04825 [Clavibacter michiganensis]|nr:hypothetical protein BFL35_04825 [Clavibacter michiganensis]
MYPNREVFAHAPLALVAAELRFSDLPRMRQQATRDLIAIAMEDRFPLVQVVESEGFSMTPEGPVPIASEALGLRNLEHTEILTVSANSITFETSNYSSFDSLLAALLEACDALLDVKVKPALQRIGLRYIDEVRVPGPINNVKDWLPWISEDVIGLVNVGSPSAIPNAFQSLSSYSLGNNRGLNVRAAALHGNSIVATQNLVRPKFEDGPFFVLDFDGFELFEEGPAVLLSSQVVADSLHAVHTPAGDTFQRSITDRARKLFRGESHVFS